MSATDPEIGVWVPHGRFTLAASGEGSLSGLKFVVKDVFDIAGHPTGAGNPTWLATHDVPGATHPVIERLRAAGAQVIGKVLTDELAYSLNGDNVHYGTPRNVNAAGRVPGGSSSGSAAAVAAGIADFGLGTDTGGSTRVPASYCGIWGLRTTHGLLPTSNMVALHPSFDTVTWFAGDHDIFARVGRTLLSGNGFRARRILVSARVRNLATPDFHPHLDRVVDELSRLQQAPVVETDVLRDAEDDLERWRRAYVTMGAYEAWRLHGEWISKYKPAFAPAIASRWQAAAQVGGEEFNQARAQVASIREHVRNLLGDDGVLVVPSAAGIAPLIGASGQEVDALRARTMHITCIAGIGGLCQVSIPFRNNAGLPLGISLVGPAGSDLDLIEMAGTIRPSVY